MNTATRSPNKTLPKLQDIILVISGIFIILAFIILIFFYLHSTMEELMADYQYSALFENQLNDLLSNLQDAETGQRGYLLTEKESYLVPYYSAKSNSNKIMNGLLKKARKNQQEVQKLQEIKRLSNSKYAELAKTISLNDNGLRQESLNLVKTDEGKLLMDSIRFLIAELRQIEKENLKENNAAMDKLYRTSSWSIIIAGILLIGILGFLYGFLRPLFKRIDNANRVLRENQILIASKNQQLEHFAYITSHDLKEPLRTITSFIKLFETEYGHTLVGKGKEYCDFISDAVKRMERMVHSILNYAQLGESKPFSETDLDLIVHNLKQDLKSLIEQNNAQIYHDKLPKIMANATEIRQVFQNLITNAIKFKHAELNPVIHLSFTETDDHWAFTVKDNGIGIPKAKLQKIFNFFTRLHPASKYEGQGIGLAFCKKIIELHGGQITADSELEKGSIFTFTIAKNL